MIRILGNKYNEIEKESLVALWKIILDERDLGCHGKQCTECKQHNLYHDLEKTYEWLVKNYG